MKKQILIVVQKLTVGGITSSLVNFIDFLNEKYPDTLEIDLFTFSSLNCAENIPKNISITHGNKLLELSATSFFDVLRSKNIVNIFMRIILMLYVRIAGSEKFYGKILKKHTNSKKYDVAISYSNDVPGDYFNQGTNRYVAEFVEADEKLAWIHTDPIKMGFDKKHCENIYRKYNRIICVSGAVKESFDSLLPIYSDKTEVFYNVFNEKQILNKANEYIPFDSAELFNIVTVCRIDDETKRVCGIVHLCSRLKKEGILDFKWRVVGNGPSLKRNMKLSKELNVLDVLEFVGEKKNPYPYILHSDLFALYSAYEGHPMVIGEAIATGTYVLTKNYAAAKEQIGEEHGVIASSDEEFYQQIKTIIKLKGKKKHDTVIKCNSSCI